MSAQAKQKQNDHADDRGNCLRGFRYRRRNVGSLCRTLREGKGELEVANEKVAVERAQGLTREKVKRAGSGDGTERSDRLRCRIQVCAVEDLACSSATCRRKHKWEFFII